MECLPIMHLILGSVPSAVKASRCIKQAVSILSLTYLSHHFYP